MLNDAARALIESGPIGHFTTLNPDGSPQTTCIWPGMDGDTRASRPSRCARPAIGS